MKNRKLWMCTCVCLLVLLGGCAASHSSNSASISPSAAALAPGQSAQFQATLPGNPKSIVWSVNGVAGGNGTVGTIDASGNYTAPTDTQSIAVTIAAASGSGSSSSASAQAYVVAPGVVEPTQNPQVALYTITPPAAANVTIQFGPTTSYGRSTWAQGSPSTGGPVNIFVAGMLANSTYHMQATLQFGPGVSFTDADHVFATGTFPVAQLPSITAATTAGMTPQSGVELLDLIGIPATGKVGVAVSDLSGNVLWTYAPGPVVAPAAAAYPIKLLPNGHFLINYAGVQTDGGQDSVLQEVDLSGQVIWQLTAAQLNAELAAATCTGCNITVVGTHHDFAILPNGHLVVIAATQQVVSGVTVTGDVLIDLDQNRKPVWLWNEFDHLDITRRPYMYPDWTHTNAVIYSADDGDLIISMRHQNWLVKIDYANGNGSGDIVWHLGYQGDFTLLNADGSTADPTSWFFAQHGPSFTTPNTTGKYGLTVFDDGDDRGVAVVAGGTCGVTGQPACYTDVPVLNIDETAMTATLAFDPMAPAYSFFGGNAEVLKNGNLEYGLCATTALPQNNGAVLEVTQTSPSQTVWELQVAGQFVYRGMRIPSLYPGVQW